MKNSKIRHISNGFSYDTPATLKKLDAPQIKSQTMQHILMNLVNKILFEKIWGLIIKSKHLYVLDSCVYISLYPWIWMILWKYIHPIKPSVGCLTDTTAIITNQISCKRFSAWIIATQFTVFNGTIWGYSWDCPWVI